MPSGGSPRKEAIDSELYIAGKDHVNYNADYDVKAYAEEGSQKLYQGPGTKYGEVPGVRDIENGETLHITQDAELVDGSHWGVTTVDGNRRLDGSGEDRRMARRNIRKQQMQTLMHWQQTGLEMQYQRKHLPQN